jgi:hypothetical protein
VRGDRIRRAVAGERGGYELLKGTRRASGEPWEAAYNQSGRLVDFSRVRAQMMRARLDRYGKLEPRLHARVRGGGTDRLSVAVWLRAGALVKPTKDERREARTPARGEGPTRKAYADQARSVVARYGLDSASRKLRVDGAAPVIFAEVDRQTIRRLADAREVSKIFLYERDGAEDLTDSIAIAQSDDAHALGYTGAG